MRNPLTLEPDVMRSLKNEARRSRSPLNVVLNDAIRRGLRNAKVEPLRPYRLRVHKAKLRAGIGPRKFQSIAEELELESGGWLAK